MTVLIEIPVREKRWLGTGTPSATLSRDDRLLPFEDYEISSIVVSVRLRNFHLDDFEKCRRTLRKKEIYIYYFIYTFSRLKTSDSQ